jgi:hypothetical protein
MGFDHTLMMIGVFGLSSDHRVRGSSLMIDGRARTNRKRPGSSNTRTWSRKNSVGTEFWRAAARV